MINQIAYMVSFNDKNMITGNVNFSNYVCSYEKGKMFDLLNKGYDNSIFFIGETRSKFYDIFFKMGFLYRIMKENNFIGKISKDGKEHNIYNFSDYYDIVGNLDVTYLNAETRGRKYSFTFISCDRVNNFMDTLRDFTKLKGPNNNININFVYEIDSNSVNFNKIIDININLNKNEPKKIKFNPKITLYSPPVTPNKKTKKHFRPTTPPVMKSKKPIIKQSLDDHDKILDDIIENDIINEPIKNKTTDIIKFNPNTKTSQLIDDIVGMLEILDTGKMNKSIILPNNNNDNITRNEKIHQVNLKLHRKIINNFQRLRLSKDNLDIQDNIIDETLDILEECNMLLRNIY